jgi:hypothetical protein
MGTLWRSESDALRRAALEPAFVRCSVRARPSSSGVLSPAGDPSPERGRLARSSKGRAHRRIIAGEPPALSIVLRLTAVWSRD